MPIIPACRRLKEENCPKLKASRATEQDLVLKEKKRTKKQCFLVWPKTQC